jgi:hypothetical protein
MKPKRRKPAKKSRVTERDLKPLYVYMQAEAWTLVERISQRRAEAAAGVVPNRADLWREGMMRGLRQMLRELEGDNAQR